MTAKKQMPRKSARYSVRKRIKESSFPVIRFLPAFLALVDQGKAVVQNSFCSTTCYLTKLNLVDPVHAIILHNQSDHLNNII